MPISWHGTPQQYVGRLHRLHDRKKIVEVYDYVDSSIRCWHGCSRSASGGYKALGYSISEQEPPLGTEESGRIGRPGLLGG